MLETAANLIVCAALGVLATLALLAVGELIDLACKEAIAFLRWLKVLR